MTRRLDPRTALLSVLVNIIIPRDAKSGSATDSGAIPYMDFVVGDGSERSKTAWRDGLRWFDEEAEVWDAAGRLVAQSRQIARVGRGAVNGAAGGRPLRGRS